MPTSKSQRVVFAFLSVIITVHCFVFYNLAIESGGMSNHVFAAAYSSSEWVLPVPIILLEFVFAMLLEVFVAGPLSQKLAFRAIDPKKSQPQIVTTAVICATVCLMCPMMSLIAAVLYYVIPVVMNGGAPTEFFAQWLQKVVFNFPFAFFTELFFIQPFVRMLFGKIYGSPAGQECLSHTGASANQQSPDAPVRVAD